ncbi:MAG: C4-type zinc ribbon domain-containing protein [Actinobacteria bacterium]|nr:C4-type zinc ribbon domain-containing protein [Actinomycetota bacterium]
MQVGPDGAETSRVEPDSSLSSEGDADDHPLEVLMRVQDLDTEIAQLNHRRSRLSERAELDEVQRVISQMVSEISQERSRLEDLYERQKEMDDQVSAISRRRQAIEERMYQERGSSGRDLQAMDAEVLHLTQRRSEIEDAELSLMEEQDLIESKIKSREGELAELTKVADELSAALKAAEAVVDAEISTVTMSRGLTAVKLPTDLADRYEVLRSRLKGTGAARLVGNRCGGCHLELPSMEVEKISRLSSDVVVTCDQCGRILVRERGGSHER